LVYSVAARLVYSGLIRNNLEGFSHLPALTGEKLKLFNFKPLSDGRGADYLSHRKNTVL